MNRKRKYYRVCHKDTIQGLWYDYNGGFTGFIHEKFNFCKNNELRMEFDEEIVGWLSATDTLESLFHWFTSEDIKQLQEHGWFIHEFEAEDVKFYERFQHLIIKQDTSKPLRIIDINEVVLLPHEQTPLSELSNIELLLWSISYEPLRQPCAFEGVVYKEIQALDNELEKRHKMIKFK